jgi:hypothetical protein
MDAIRQADVVAVVCTPSPVDAWTARETAHTVNAHKRKGARAGILFNMVQAHTLLSHDLDGTAARIGLPAFKSTVARRTCYAHAALYGMKALTATAREELLRLALEMVTR